MADWPFAAAGTFVSLRCCSFCASGPKLDSGSLLELGFELGASKSSLLGAIGAKRSSSPFLSDRLLAGKKWGADVGTPVA